jgi:very-short-patch-repair endonuclease
MPQFRPRDTKRAQELRNNATDAERRLWSHLRDRRLGGHKFSRQMSVGPFVCDFLCRERGLVVELDGGQHAERAVQDKRRTAFLNAEGLTVLRFWNNDVFEDMDGVLELILVKLEELLPKFARPPLPLAGGEEPRSGEGVGPAYETSHNAPTPQPPPATGRGLS